MKIDLVGALTGAAETLTTKRAGERKRLAEFYAFNLREIAKHAQMVRRGEATIEQFQDLYGLRKVDSK